METSLFQTMVSNLTSNDSPQKPDLFENLPLSKMKKQRSEIFAILEQQESLSNNYSVDVSEWTKHSSFCVVIGSFLIILWPSWLITFSGLSMAWHSC